MVLAEGDRRQILPTGLPELLADFVRAAAAENLTLRENGAEQAAAARDTLLNKLLVAADAHLNEEVDVAEAAQLTGRCEETIRRAARSGKLPVARQTTRGRYRIRRGDLAELEALGAKSYDPDADARDLARHRRNLE